MLQGQVIKGLFLLPATTGKKSQNGWGLHNYVGNAQEWLRTGSGVVARGGGFEDQLSKCEPSFSKPHSGSPDKITGFRLVRELG